MRHFSFLCMNSYSCSIFQSALLSEITGREKKSVGGEDINSEEETYQGAITPFTETTINLADGPMSPEGDADDEKPTFDHYQDPRYAYVCCVKAWSCTCAL